MFTSTLLLALSAATAYAAPTCSSRSARPTGGVSSATATGAGAPAATGAPTASGASTSTGTTSGGAVQCPVVLDGRVPSTFALTDFDTSNGIFNPDYVKGNNLSWSDILLFPETANSRFDNSSYKSIEVTISDESIFQQQTGFRRAGLQFNSDTNENSTGYLGVKTLHWSVKQDSERALNLSHEYLNVWHEAADYSADQIMFQTGKMIDIPDLAEDSFKIFDRSFNLLWSTPIDSSEWQNFAITMDIDSKYVSFYYYHYYYNNSSKHVTNMILSTVQIYYSLGTAALTAVTDVVTADLSGMGQFQLGILKKPTGTADVSTSGYQESQLNEGLIYGGLFVEDSTGGCVSL